MSAAIRISGDGGSLRRTWPLIFAIMLPGPAAAEVVIRLSDGDRPRIVVEGLPDESLAALANVQMDHATWQRILSLYVAEGAAENVPAMLGDYEVTDDRLIFSPRFPFKLGLDYRAELDGSAIPTDPVRGLRVETLLRIPALPSAVPTVVDSVFPSSDVLPENQLKFYIHFSAPMSRGDIYRHIRLLDAAGTTVAAPFLELAEELWDDSGRRLTLLMDPGRVKRDLKPHEEVGRAIVEGGAYTLVIADDWRDARGERLGGPFRKEFRVTKPDERQPDPKRWRLTLPREGTRQPLVIAVDEPLDHAMLRRTIRVSNTETGIVDGRVAIDKQETRWSFLPTAPWLAGGHQLLIDANLEDLAGNSIARPFEVYLPSGRPSEVEQVTISFQIGEGAAGVEAAASSR